MLRLLLVKEQGAVGGDVAGVAEAVATIHEVGSRLLLSLAVLEVKLDLIRGIRCCTVC